MRPRTASLLLATSLLLAGCTISSSQPRPYETPLNGTAVDATHERVLSDAGSFTYHERRVIRTENRTNFGNRSSRIDLDAGVAVLNVTDPDAEPGGYHSSRYLVAGGENYKRTRTDGEVDYLRYNLSRNLREFARLNVASVTSNLTVTANGTTTLDGETVYVYSVRENRTDDLLSSGAVVNVTIRYYVRGDGLVKRMESRITVVSGALPSTVVSTRSYSQVGSTDVTEPAWVTAARANTT